MKVLHVINNLRREGAQIVLRNLVTANAAAGVRHAVWVRDPMGGPLREELERRGVAVHAPNRYYGAAATRRSLAFLAKAAEEEGADVLHAHMADAAFLAWLAARKLSLPFVITHHGHDPLPRGGRLCRSIYWALLMASSRAAARNVAVSSSVVERLRVLLRLPDRSVALVENGVPVPSIAEWPRNAERPSFAPNVVAVGRLVELKGYDQLIDAISILSARLPQARLTIVGDGPLRDRLVARAATLGIAERVAFVGAVDDVAPYLRSAAVFVSSSHREGMSMAVLEAMAWGVPIVASDIPGNRALVEDGVTGLLYPTGDVRALAARLIDVVARREDALDRAGAARRFMEARFSAAASARDYGRLYAEILAADGARRERPRAA
jgi:glycosyltransferase involved in cell wall biosynthesis